MPAGRGTGIEGSDHFGEIELAGVALRTLASCHSLWLFDLHRMRFQRVPRGSRLDVPVSSSEWTPYHRVDIDPSTGVFVVSLDEQGTKLLRSRVHLDSCPHHHADDRTGELALKTDLSAL